MPAFQELETIVISSYDEWGNVDSATETVREATRLPKYKSLSRPTELEKKSVKQAGRVAENRAAV